MMKIKSNRSCLFLIFIYFVFSSTIHAQKILLTGGAGFIGSHVAQKLLERGDSVVIVDNINDAYDYRIKEYNLSLVVASDTNNQLSVYKIDICDSDVVDQICATERPDVICHLAARAEYVQVLPIHMNILELIMMEHWLFLKLLVSMAYNTL